MKFKISPQLKTLRLDTSNRYIIYFFLDNFQIDACDACNNNNTDHETSGDNYDSQEDEWLQKQYKR